MYLKLSFYQSFRGLAKATRKMARKEKPKLFSVVGKKVSQESRNKGKIAQGDPHFTLGIYYI